MKIFCEGLAHCLLVSEYLLPECFGHFIFILCSGNLEELTGCFAAVSVEECS